MMGYLSCCNPSNGLSHLLTWYKRYNQLVDQKLQSLKRAFASSNTVTDVAGSQHTLRLQSLKRAFASSNWKGDYPDVRVIMLQSLKRAFASSNSCFSGVTFDCSLCCNPSNGLSHLLTGKAIIPMSVSSCCNPSNGLSHLLTLVSRG